MLRVGGKDVNDFDILIFQRHVSGYRRTNISL